MVIVGIILIIIVAYLWSSRQDKAAQEERIKKYLFSLDPECLAHLVEALKYKRVSLISGFPESQQLSGWILSLSPEERLYWGNLIHECLTMEAKRQLYGG